VADTRKQTCLGCHREWDAPNVRPLVTQCNQCGFRNAITLIVVFVIAMALVMAGPIMDHYGR